MLFIDLAITDVVVAGCPLSELLTSPGAEAADAEGAGPEVAGAVGATLAGLVPVEEPHAPSKNAEASPTTRFGTVRRGIKKSPFVGSRICLFP
ncbi:hypothetical protein [Streptomyces sp. NPDC101234]|uniref:hypothetical protein n=1 Tax=Streptomyces sp. NPDC101234 TaxID=3366138 RepID=UPI0037FD2A13